MRGIASFIAGMGRGYMRAKDKEYDRQRQEKQDAWMEEQRNRQRQDWKEADTLKTDLKDAAAPRQTVQGTETTAGGTRVFSQSPENAAAMQKMLANEAELTGEAPTQQATTAMTGAMSKGHQIGATADGQNTPDARNQRVTDALMQNGQVERAASMEATALDLKAKKLGLDAAQLKFADEKFNRDLGETFANAPDWTAAAAKVLTDTQVGGLAGMTVTPKPSADGKKVDFVAQGADGAPRVLASFGNTDAGKAQFLQRVMRAPVETKIGWIVESEKAKQSQANEDRKFALDERKFNSDTQYRNRVLSMRSAGGGGSGAAGGDAMPDPMAGFDSKKAYAVAVDQATAELSQGATPATAEQIAARANSIFRALQSEHQRSGTEILAREAFARSAQQAESPQELQALYDKGIQYGMTPQQMAAIDPRFTPSQSAAGPAGAPPAARSGESKTPSKGLFTDDKGQVQLLQPFINMGEWRRRMVNEQNEKDAARGF